MISFFKHPVNVSILYANRDAIEITRMCASVTRSYVCMELHYFSYSGLTMVLQWTCKGAFIRHEFLRANIFALCTISASILSKNQRNGESWRMYTFVQNNYHIFLFLLFWEYVCIACRQLLL